MRAEMKICFIGIGSIAQRHIRNLHEILAETRTAVQIDAVRRNASLDGLDVKPLIHRVYTDTDQLGQYDVIFITNPTEMHLDTLRSVRGKAKAYFIEKPVTSFRNIADAQDDLWDSDGIYYVACPLRYKKVVQYIKDFAAENRIIGVRAISSSYLPEWRPGQDYRNTYSAQKALGGGVSIDLIHEWDYLRHIFGMPQRVSYFGGKKSDLEMDAEDTAIYLAEYADKYVELHLDYFGRETIRECMLFTDKETVVADLVKNEVRFLKQNRTIVFEESRDDFQKAELRHFLEIVAGTPSDSTIREAVQTLYLTQGVVYHS